MDPLLSIPYTHDSLPVESCTLPDLLNYPFSDIFVIGFIEQILPVPGVIRFAFVHTDIKAPLHYPGERKCLFVNSHSPRRSRLKVPKVALDPLRFSSLRS